nr:hypothetical protein [Streptomyces shenzhenensis]
MLTAVMRHLEAKAIDEAPDLFQVLMATRLLNTAKRKTEKERLSTLPQLEKPSRTLARAAKVLFEELELVEEHGADLDVAAQWAAVEEDELAGLSPDMPVAEHLAELVRGLDAGWKLLTERLEEAGPAAKVSIEAQDDGRVKLNVGNLGALGEPKS